MQEITITSGRAMSHIDPVLSVFGWEIPVYLFLGGLVAGILFFSTLFFLLGKTESMPTAVKKTPIFAPIFLGIGLFALFLDLEYKLHLYSFYMTLRMTSPMSWGSWTLAVIFPLSALWTLVFVEEAYPGLMPKIGLLQKVIDLCKKFKVALAWMTIVFAVLLGMYTGILLSAFNARPLWNTAILGPLFLASGLSAGVALSILLSKNAEEKKLLTKIDLMIIAVEMFFIIHLFMGLLSSTQVHFDAAQLFLGGEFTAVFWIFVVGFGITVPALLEVLELRGKHIPAMLPAIMVISGSLIMRFIIVQAGQVSTWLPY